MSTLVKGLAAYLTIFCSLILTAQSCAFHGEGDHLSGIDFRSLTAQNIAARSAHRRSAPTRMAITNVRVFDGSSLSPPRTVMVENGLIAGFCEGSDNCTAPQSYDGSGKTLLPGLMDSHAHPNKSSDLVSLTRYGVTTTVNAFCPDPMFCKSLTNHTGLTSVISSSFYATSPDSLYAKMVGPKFGHLLIQNTTMAPSWVTGQVQGGADFIKLVGSAPGAGLSQDEQTALVAASHREGKFVVLHTSNYQSYEEGLIAGVDQIHHSTLDVPIDGRLLAMFKGKNAPKLVCPTLTMMRAITQKEPSSNASYSAAAETARRLHGAGVPLIVGTDSNSNPQLPGNPVFGSSIHDELENLVAVGLSPIEALNAATVSPTKFFGLADRGVIRQGMRADLLLVDGDPTKNITATRNIVKIWVGGVEFDEEIAAKATATTSAGSAGGMPTSSTSMGASSRSLATSIGGAMRAAAIMAAPAGLLAYVLVQ